jgi:hypothetical protein
MGWRGKDTVEGSRCLDILSLYHKGMLHYGCFGWAWYDSRSGEKTASIGVKVLHRGALELSYTVTPRSGDPEDMQYIVPLEWRPCNYGGERPYFFCPLCTRRVSKLYMNSGRYFACRKCNDLAYASQQESYMFRILSQAQKIREKLGGSTCTFDPFPERPRYMHRLTYWRLQHWYYNRYERSLNMALTRLGSRP